MQKLFGRTAHNFAICRIHKRPAMVGTIENRDSRWSLLKQFAKLVSLELGRGALVPFASVRLFNLPTRQHLSGDFDGMDQKALNFTFIVADRLINAIEVGFIFRAVWPSPERRSQFSSDEWHASFINFIQPIEEWMPFQFRITLARGFPA